MGSAAKLITKAIKRGFSGILFPDVCVCCGLEITEYQKQICSFCLSDRFEDANPGNRNFSSTTLPPEGVVMQHALWNYDRGGTLQHLLHQLKYQRLAGIGRQLGSRLAVRAKAHPGWQVLAGQFDPVLVPVPLHYLKFMRRGFNQAYSIALGIRDRLDLPICEAGDLSRVKNTRSQTGFTIEKRSENMKGAFKVINPGAFQGKLSIIIDDVFTTGATTFELSGTLFDTGTLGVVIWTVAQA